MQNGLIEVKLPWRVEEIEAHAFRACSNLSSIEKAMGKLPAGGKYSTGDTKESIDDEMKVEWEGMTGSIKIGFDFSKSGLKSIFLMQGTKVNGTPRMKPVAGLKSAIYGSKTQKEIAEIQEKVLSNHIKKVMEG